MNEQAESIFELAKDAHRAMRMDPASAKSVIESARQKIEQAADAAKSARNPSLAAFTARAIGYLDSMATHARYQGAFAGGLAALERRLVDVAE